MKKAGRALAAWRVYREVKRPGTPGLMTRVRAIPRMLRGTLRGDYPHLSKRKVGMMGLGVAYIVSPLDVVPDFLAVLGVVDDFGVFLWLMTALLSESGQYLDWERHHLTGRPEHATGRTGLRQGVARSETGEAPL